MPRGIGPVFTGGRAAAKKAWKPAVVAFIGWAGAQFGDKVADDGYDRFKGKASKAAEERHQEALAQTPFRARGWKCQRFVVDHAERFLVWSNEKRTMAAFLPVQDASTSEALAARFEVADAPATNYQALVAV